MVRLINRLLCALGVHDRFFVEDSRTSVIVEHCRWCGYSVRLYRRRNW